MSFYNYAAPNNSMDVRAKQLLSFDVVRYPLLACIQFRPTSSQPFGGYP